MIDVSWLCGATITDVEAGHRLGGLWSLRFTNDINLHAEGFWRVVSRQRVVLSRGDHGARIGRGQVIDAAAELKRNLGGRPVEHAAVGAHGDLRIRLDTGDVFEVLVSSSVYESWSLLRDGHTVLVSTGGGHVAEFPFTPSPTRRARRAVTTSRKVHRGQRR